LSPPKRGFDTAGEAQNVELAEAIKGCGGK
jgi:hypothetical protein